MADEQESIAPLPELDTPAIAAPEADAPEVEKPETVGLPEVEPEQDTDTQPEPEIEFISVERNGKTYQVPKDLEGEFLMHADYTRKRQADAAKAKELESREVEINQRAEATDAELDARAELKAVSTRLDEYAKLTAQDWAAHRANDPIGTENAWTEYQLLKDRKGELEGVVTKARTERTERQQADLAKRVQETLAHVNSATNSLGYKSDAIPQLVEFAQKMGIPEDTITSNWSPLFADLLHLARTGQQLLNKPAPTPKAPAPAPAPLEKVTGKTTPAANKTLAELAKGDDLEAYAKARQSGRVR